MLQGIWDLPGSETESVSPALACGFFTTEPPGKPSIYILYVYKCRLGFPGGSVGKESACNAGDPGSIPGFRKICWRRDRLPTPVFLGFPCGSADKESACSAGDLGLIPGLGRSPGEGKGYPLQYFGLENPMDRGAWWATVHGVIESWTRLSNQHFHFY